MGEDMGMADSISERPPLRQNSPPSDLLKMQSRIKNSTKFESPSTVSSQFPFAQVNADGEKE